MSGIENKMTLGDPSRKKAIAYLEVSLFIVVSLLKRRERRKLIKIYGSPDAGNPLVGSLDGNQTSN
jgi:hypothetical protein